MEILDERVFVYTSAFEFKVETLDPFRLVCYLFYEFVLFKRISWKNESKMGLNHFEIQLVICFSKFLDKAVIFFTD